jgi:SNF2 family DNA or RNA helicase
MRIPYVIDNRDHKLADVLNFILGEYAGRSLDIATGYFTVGGFNLLREGLGQLSSFRLLLGAEPDSGEALGLRPRAQQLHGLLTRDLERLPYDEKTLRAVEALIAYLRRNSVAVRLFGKGFLHAKCYLFYADRPAAGVYDRFKPVAGIVGSSNFTYPGLATNRELNLAHKTVLDREEALDKEARRAVSMLLQEDMAPGAAGEAPERPGAALAEKSEVGARAILDLEQWYQTQWEQGEDFKDDLIAILDASKFGENEYTPFEVYMKALYAYLREDLAAEEQPATRSVVDLAEFQEDAVKKARRILMTHNGVMVADSVGLGKTWIGKKLLEDYAYHMRLKAVVVCPASLRQMWESELHNATIAAEVLSQEVMGWESFDPGEYQDADVVLIDESHNFRNPNAARYENMERLIGGNRGRGREGQRKKVILLTATPINNDLLDLYQQLRLITQNDRAYFASCGVGDLHKYFLRARRASHASTAEGAIGLFNLLEEIVIRRTRPFIKKAYPDATIRGERIHFPQRKLKTVGYDLEATYGGIYDEVVSGIERLHLAPYNLEAYLKEGVQANEMEAGRQQALVGIFKSRYLKRFESSIQAFRISVRRALAFQKTFEAYLLDGKLMRSRDFHRGLRYLEREDEEDDATPRSLAEDLDENEDARHTLESMESIDTARYSLRKIHEAVESDVTVLKGLWDKVKDIKPHDDAKLQRLKSLLRDELMGRKVLIFTYYKDTARYLFRELGDPRNPDAVALRECLGGVTIRRMDGGSDPKERAKLVRAFAPESNGASDLQGTDREIDILISTDVLSEGQNLQDCGTLVNFDLHWNPTRMVQRAGRVDRIGSRFDVLWLYNMFPDAGLERLLRLVERLNQRISDIDRLGFLDASVLGEAVHPQNFNTLRRIKDEDGSVIEEEEEFIELASSEFLAQQLRAFIEANGKESLDSLPDGIHSGLVKQGSKGAFFYFQGRPQNAETMHFWRYYDLKTNNIIDNRYLIANLIQCQKDTKRVVEAETFRGVFELQEYVIENILQTFRQQQAFEAAPRTTDPVQQTVTTTIRGFLNHPEVTRPEAMHAMRFLREPLMGVQIKALRQAYTEFTSSNDILTLLGVIEDLESEAGGLEAEAPQNRTGTCSLAHDDLQLICFDFLSGG